MSGAAVALSALLLFSVQPVIAKMILPWYGGSAGVWAVCLCFFQSLLLAGYVYADLLIRRVPPRTQVWVHAGLLALSLLSLPVIPGDAWKPQGGQEPTLGILLLLAATVGAPYFLLSSTSPLVQSWYSRAGGGRLPYRLFALSNLASLTALLAYPVLIEPNSSAGTQARGWSAVYALFAALILAVAWRGTRGEGVEGGPSPSAPPWSAAWRWFALAAVPSAMLLAVTNHLCQDVASVPFLWIAPLSAYLITFILCFDSDRIHRWPIWPVLAAAGVAAMAWGEMQGQLAVRIALPLFLGGLFAVCMYCHAQLAARKPDPSQLTSYYVMISLGGAVGSLLVALGAPQWQRGYIELPVGVALCGFVLLFAEYRKHWIGDGLWAGVAVAGMVGLGATYMAWGKDIMAIGRNFYGVLRVKESAGVRTLLHGSISHGTQLLDKPSEPTSYYTKNGGAGLAIRSTPGPARRIGVVGLGAGTLAVYAEAGDVYRFYEINPLVVAYAEKYFSFLRDCGGKAEILIGDGRLLLEREPPQNYDVLVIDAFSGDSVPAHLLSKEAITLYFRHLKSSGILAMHVSNRHLRLVPVVERGAASVGAAFRHVDNGTSEWVLAAASESVFERELLKGRKRSKPEPGRVWTDDYSNLLGVLR
jgi:spermidine synthase